MEDLARHTCLRHRWSTTGKLQEWVLANDRKRVDLERPAPIVLTTVEPLIEMATRGVGTAWLPSFAVRGKLRTGGLVSIFDDCSVETSTRRILWPSGRQVLPKVRTFIDFISERMEGEVAGTFAPWAPECSIPSCDGAASEVHQPVEDGRKSISRTARTTGFARIDRHDPRARR